MKKIFVFPYLVSYLKIDLQAIGLKPFHSRELLFAFGCRERRFLIEALFAIYDLNEMFTVPVIFAPLGVLYLMGAIVLENFRIEVDTTARKLKPVSGLIANNLSPDKLEL